MFGLKKLFSLDKSKKPNGDSSTTAHSDLDSPSDPRRPTSRLERNVTPRPPPPGSTQPTPEIDGSVPLALDDIEIIDHMPDVDTQIPIHTEDDVKPDTFIGTVLTGRYEIQELIGKGGMGRVYKAYQRTVDRTVALKILNSTMAANPELVKRFRLEARAASQLSHPNTITIHDFGHTAKNILFIVMEYLQGFPLTRLFKQSPTPERVLKIMLQVCGSLGEAHQRGIVHRDLKPANILLCRIGNDPEYAKVLDFGIAKIATANTNITQGGIIFGTPKYMSPEQCNGEMVDSRSDIFSLGILMYELLSGVPAFTVDSPVGYFYQHVNTDPRPLSEVPSHHPISKKLASVVMKMLAKKPADRFQKVEELNQLFVDVLNKDYHTVTTGSAHASLFIGRSSRAKTRRLTPASELERLQKQLSEKPDEISILKTLAQLYENNGELNKAVQVYTKIAEIHIQFESHEDAVPVLSKVLDINKDNTKARMILAQSFSHLGKCNEAIDHFKILVNAFEKSKDQDNLIAALLQLASVYADIDDQLQAKSIWERVKKLSQDKTVSETVGSRLLIEEDNDKNKPITKKDNNEMSIDSMLPSMEPVSVHLDNADFLIKKRKYQEALTAVRKALILDPENKTALRTASIILKKGRTALSPDECAWLNILVPARRNVNMSNTAAGPAVGEISNELLDILKKDDLVLVNNTVLQSAYCEKKCEIAKFAISRTPVTNEQFHEYIKATGEIPPRDWYGSKPPTEKKLHPVVGISMKQALRYTEWRGLRLPTLLEWECAARGTDGRSFPWGDNWNHSKCHCKENGANSTCAVTRYCDVQSPHGCIDMIGNVWEWTTPDHRLKLPDPGYTWVIGGSYKHPCEKNGKIALTSVSEESAYGYLGFRCAVDVSE